MTERASEDPAGLDGDHLDAIDDPTDAPESGAPSARTWPTNLGLFIATTISVFLAGSGWVFIQTIRIAVGDDGTWKVIWPQLGVAAEVVSMLASGYEFAIPLLAILLFHEFGHYFAARIHRVPASLPYFIPMPFLSPFGTMGAVIAMKGRIRSRNALLDIGAAGPLAGLCVAIPVLAYGLSRSAVAPIQGGGILEGQSLLYLAMKRIVCGPIPAGYDVFLHPIALAGWTGLFVTMLNLLPVGQLDGGHIAYALFGPRQNRYARVFHHALLLCFLYNAVKFGVAAATGVLPVGVAMSNSAFWLVWFGLVHLLARLGGRDHPPTEPGDLSPVRRIVAGVSLLFFVLLFMPTPWSMY